MFRRSNMNLTKMFKSTCTTCKQHPLEKLNHFMTVLYKIYKCMYVAIECGGICMC